MNRLTEIIAVKQREIEKLRPRAEALRRRALARNDFRSLRSALHRSDAKLAVIAEIKKASPSAGTIVDTFAPRDIAREYERSGASAISVLTDTQFFKGDPSHMTDARAAVTLPVLRKDFIIDEIQIAEACAMGADAVLLIVAALDQAKLLTLAEAAAKYQLDALVEVHTFEEMERALEADSGIIGINNRDLTTLEIDLGVTERLSEEVPNDVVLVSESGMRTPADIARVRACGVNAVLIGEALMRGELSLEVITG
jgi:indole-3-glycerol phosphate synthase